MNENFPSATRLHDVPFKQPSVFLDFLLSYWGTSAQAEPTTLGWTLQQLQSSPILDRSILSGDGGWDPTESVQLTMALEPALHRAVGEGAAGSFCHVHAAARCSLSRSIQGSCAEQGGGAGVSDGERRPPTAWTVLQVVESNNSVIATCMTDARGEGLLAFMGLGQVSSNASGSMTEVTIPVTVQAERRGYRPSRSVFASGLIRLPFSRRQTDRTTHTWWKQPAAHSGPLAGSPPAPCNNRASSRD
jgi:hypothetical protein